MRIVFAGTLLAAMVVMSPAHAQNQGDRYCRDMQIDRGTVPYCMSNTMEQCLASRASPNERCYLNPRYDPRLR